MNTTIQDSKILSSVDATSISHYLRAKGWKRLATEEARYSLWATIEGSTSAELLVPLNQRFADYSLRISELLDTLVRFEARSRLEILEDVQNVTSDVFRFRTDPPVNRPGTIPLDEGVRLVTGARDMIVAAANAEHEQRLLFTRPSSEAEEILRSVLFGQTERSSYVVTALVSVPPSLQLSLHEDLEPVGPDPLERRLGIRLISSLDALADAALESAAKGSADPIREAVQYGVSLNLCRALAGSHAGSGSVVVSARWAPVRTAPAWAPARPDRPLPALVEFQQPLLRQVQEVVSTLSAVLPREGVRVYGHVEVLKRPVQEELFGEILILGFAEDQQRKIRVRLPRDLYHQAIIAHEEKRLVSVVGRLVSRGTRHYLEEPTDFFLVPEGAVGDDAD